ncbi:BlaI/MecI/CopY family transcriptional regulator [Desnuesiella massiliensis]|uniref:BlaI/MecI/CopY family transcriptional regulator n=1 Tax=Desnuesiella massiliensis TaxID=1650662 RepID=UPI0006E40E35|nr:BlaI/MecI/CopY family transcriptional regulator [Desnuesiella massiliensis]
MKELPKISDAEWQVMKVLWDKAPLTSAEIIDDISENTTWSPKTIHTLISRLVKKGAIEVNKEGTFYKYNPLVSQKELRREETKSFIEKIYDGSLKLLISNFIKEENLTQEEIEDLKQILNEKKE